MVNFDEEDEHDHEHAAGIEVADVEGGSKTPYVGIGEDDHGHQAGGKLHSQPLYQVCHHSGTT